MFKFKQCASGLYYHNTACAILATTYLPISKRATNTNGKFTSCSMLTAAASNKEYFTQAEIKGADKVLSYQGILGWLTKNSLIPYVDNNLLLNCDITSDDIF